MPTPKIKNVWSVANNLIYALTLVSFNIILFAINESFGLPESNINNTEQHNKIDTVGGDLKVKVEEAVEGNGDQAA